MRGAAKLGPEAVRVGLGGGLRKSLELANALPGIGASGEPRAGTRGSPDSNELVLES